MRSEIKIGDIVQWKSYHGPEHPKYEILGVYTEFYNRLICVEGIGVHLASLFVVVGGSNIEDPYSLDAVIS